MQAIYKSKRLSYNVETQDYTIHGFETDSKTLANNSKGNFFVVKTFSYDQYYGKLKLLASFRIKYEKLKF